MKKFNKKLTINLPDDTLNTHQNESISVEPTSNNRYLQFKDGQDSQNGQNKHESANFVQFQQFTVHNIKEEETDHHKLKKKFNIDLPDRDKKQQKWSQFRCQKIQTQQFKEEEDKFKEPPAPSKGSTRHKVFVFPTTPPHKNIQKEENLNDLKKSFERERQQFYKEKSKLQKEILIKNGQIDMLQKIVKEKYSSIPSQPQCVKPSSSYKYQESSQLETILLQKDLQINELLEKISILNEALNKKSQSLNKQIIQNSTLQSLIQSLKNQLFIYEKKEVSEKMTKRFYQVKHDRYGESDWRNDDFQGSLNLGQDFGMKGLQYLQKRIEKVKMDRVEYNSRNKIKSDMSYSQTTKNKNKISFDFKGKVYDRQKKVNLNQTRMY